MRRSEAVLVAKALSDVEDFEILIEQIEATFNNVEGDFDDFRINKMMPMLKKELERRESILENM
jgi:hypothetical protein